MDRDLQIMPVASHAFSPPCGPYPFFQRFEDSVVLETNCGGSQVFLLVSESPRQSAS